MKRWGIALGLWLALWSAARAADLPLEEDAALRVIERITTAPGTRAPFSPWLLLPVFTGGVLLAVWWTLGREEAGGASIQVRYDPPAGLTPAEVGVIVDEFADVEDVTSTILDLAVRGYIRVEPIGGDGGEAPKDFLLLRGKEPDAALKAHELQMFQAIFGEEKGVMLSHLRHGFPARLPEFRRALYATAAHGGHFSGSPRVVRREAFLAGAFVVALGGTIAVLGLLGGESVARRAPPLGLHGLELALFGGVFLFVFLGKLFPSEGPPAAVGGGLLAVLAFAAAWAPPLGGAAKLGLSLASCGAIGIAFAPYMPVRTGAGRKAYEEILGFREFLTRVDADRRRRMAEEEGAHKLERLLPYALVLGCASGWNTHLEALFTGGRSLFEHGAEHVGGAFLEAVAEASEVVNLGRPWRRSDAWWLWW